MTKKSLFKKIVSAVMCLTIIIGGAFAFSGCDIAYKNSKRYSEKTIAVVGNKENREVVTLNEVMTQYLNTYQTLMYQGYTEQEVYEKALEACVKNKIMVLESKKITTLTISDENDIYADVFEQIEKNLDVYEDEIRKTLGVEKREEVEESEEKVVFDGQYKRPVPGGESTDRGDTALNNTYVAPDKETNYYRYLAYLKYCDQLLRYEQIYDKHVDDAQVAFNNEVQRLYDAYKNQKYVDEYMTYLKQQIVITDEEVLAEYKNMVNKQQQKFAADGAYADTVSKSSNFVVYHKDSSYFKVQHILFKFTDLAIDELESHEGYISQKGAESDVSESLINDFLALRDKYALDDVENKLIMEYINPNTGEKNKDDNGNDISSTITLANFKAQINAIVEAYNAVVDNPGATSVEKANAEKKLLKDFYALKFSYSQDSGVTNYESISNKIGFVLNKDENVASGFVKEFETTARELLTEYNTNGGKYTIKYVATQYGLHCMIYAGSFNEGLVANTTVESLKSTYVSMVSDQTVYDYVYEQLLAEKEATLINETYANKYNEFMANDLIDIKVSEYSDLY